MAFLGVQIAILSSASLNIFSHAFVASNHYHRPSRTTLFASNKPELDVAVVGAGPAGLLLSHLLLRQQNVKVSILESRSDPRRLDKEERAYALGLGMRGRTAIRKVDEDLWLKVKKQGFESE
jgi:kynurenine 3-monooxygenase